MPAFMTYSSVGPRVSMLDEVSNAGPTGMLVSKRKFIVTFITIVPSPYQRDLFGALAAREEIQLRVLYMENASPDSPWPEYPLRDFEQILKGFWLPVSGARVHLNWRLPDLRGADFVVLSTLVS